MVSVIGQFIQHIQDLPERNFLRLKKEEARIAADKIPAPALTEKVRITFSDYLISGNLNTPKFYMQYGGLRRYYFKAVPPLFIAAATSVVAIPGIIIRTAISALLIFKNIWSQGIVDSTDPFLQNCLNLGSAMRMTFDGIVIGIAKLAASLFRDSYKLYQERREVRENPNGNTVLLGIDLQPTFAIGGNLAIDDAEQIINPAIKMMQAASDKDIVALTQDNHGLNHKSFAVNSGWPAHCKAVMQKVAQTMWTAHAIQGTKEGGFFNLLPFEKVHFIVTKGFHDFVDSYGAFWDNDMINVTILHEILQGLNVKRVIGFGLATNVCVWNSLSQAIDLNYNVAFVEDASKGVKLPSPDDVPTIINRMKAKGIQVVNHTDVILNGKLVFPGQPAPIVG